MAENLKFKISAKDNASPAIAKVGKGIGNLSTGALKATASLAKLSVAGIAVAGVAVGTTNAKFQTLQKTLVTFTGSSEQAAKTFATIQKIAKDTPFSVSELTKSFNILASRGINPTVSQFKIFADTASASGKSFEQFAEAIADAATGEMERLKEFGIKASQENGKVVLSARSTSLEVQNSTEEIVSALVSIGQAEFAGQAAEQMDTINGSVSTLGDTFDRLMLAVGEAGLNDVIQGSIEGVNDFVEDITPSLAGLTTNFIGFFSEASDAVSEFASENEIANKVVDTATDVLDDFIKVEKKVVKSVEGVTEAVEDQTEELGDNVKIGGKGADAAKTLTKAERELLKVLRPLHSAIEQFNSDLQTLEKEHVKNTIAAKAHAKALRELIQQVTGVIDPTQKMIDREILLRTALEKLDPELEENAVLIRSIKQAIEENAEATAGLTQREQELLDKIREVDDEMSDFDTAIKDLNTLKEQGIITSEEYSQAVQKIGQEMSGTTDETFEAQEEQRKLEKAIKAVTAAGGNNAEVLKTLKNRLAEVKVETEKTFGAGARAGITEFFEGLGSDADIMKTGITTALGSIQGSFSNFFRTGKLDFGSFKDAILDMIADIAAKAVLKIGLNFLNNLFPGLGLASGGFVSGRGGPMDDQIPAMLSNGEFVMRASAVQKIGRGNLEMMNSGVPGYNTGGSVGFGLGPVDGRTRNPLDRILDLINFYAAMQNAKIFSPENLINSVFDAIKGAVGGLFSTDLGTVQSGFPEADQANFGDLLARIIELVGNLSDWDGILNFGKHYNRLFGSLGNLLVRPGVHAGVDNGLNSAGISGRGGVDDYVNMIANPMQMGLSGAFADLAKSIFKKFGFARTISDTDNIQSRMTDGLMGSISPMLGGGIMRGRAKYPLFNMNDDFSRLYSDVSPYLMMKNGGRVNSARPYVVGEAGPEVFLPNQNGTVAKIEGGQELVHAVNEVRDEITDLRRQMGRVIAGQALVGSR